jgi:hypothetical protein
MTGTGAEPGASPTPQPEPAAHPPAAAPGPDPTADPPFVAESTAGPAPAAAPEPPPAAAPEPAPAAGPEPATEPVHPYVPAPGTTAQFGSGWADPASGPPLEAPAPGYGPPPPYPPGYAPPAPGYGPPPPGYGQPGYGQPAYGQSGPGYGQPPSGPPPFGPPPQGGWPTPPPARRNRGAIIAAVTTFAVLVVGCFGVTGFFLLRSASNAASSPARRAPLPRTTFPGADPNAEPSEDGDSAQQGPQASDTPAAEVNDLGGVCDGETYFPKSPKRAGKAPHPVALLVNDDDYDVWYQDSTFYYSEGLSKAAKRTWAPDDPKAVQMVGCLERVSSGSKIRSCTYTDPKKETITLLRANWKLRVYEAATGRKLLEKAMPADDLKCPYVVLVKADKKAYAEVSDKAKVSALRKLVTTK